MIIEIPATSANLGPGFDALGLSLQMYNVAQITKQKLYSISLHGEGVNNVNLKKHNAFVNIFKDTYKSLCDKEENFRFVFENKIPFSRGLGSSSAVVVGAIAAAYHMAGFGAEKNKILNAALEYENHPDNIAPAALGGFVSSVIKDGKVYSQKAILSADLKAVVVIPDKPMSTKQSRQKLPKNYTIAQSVSNVSHAAFLTACFMQQDYDNLRYGAKDMMHEELRMQALPELFRVRELAYENGALMSTLSGSGSSFLNLAYKDSANRLKNVLAENFKDFRVEILDLDNNGFNIVKS